MGWRREGGSFGVKILGRVRSRERAVCKAGVLLFEAMIGPESMCSIFQAFCCLHLVFSFPSAPLLTYFDYSRFLCP